MYKIKCAIKLMKDKRSYSSKEIISGRRAILSKKSGHHLMAYIYTKMNKHYKKKEME